MINTTKDSTIRTIQSDAKSMDVKLNVDLNSLSISQVETLAQAFKDAKR
ncbi:MAG TPA: hypothetical protein VE944_19330 [Nostoc sp.]|nr:hypothetical protein [Nostoc sp.]HYX16475.1 hypothetical protein [Nostoc sp.]